MTGKGRGRGKKREGQDTGGPAPRPAYAQMGGGAAAPPPAQTARVCVLPVFYNILMDWKYSYGHSVTATSWECLGGKLFFMFFIFSIIVLYSLLCRCSKLYFISASWWSFGTGHTQSSRNRARKCGCWDAAAHIGYDAFPFSAVLSLCSTYH